MAKKNKIPESILKAPRLVPEYVVEHDGPNREARRHWVNHGSALKPAWVRYKTVPRVLRPAATNVPYRKTEAVSS